MADEEPHVVRDLAGNAVVVEPAPVAPPSGVEPPVPNPVVAPPPPAPVNYFPAVPDEAPFLRREMLFP
jgi:hypothetical protein